MYRFCCRFVTYLMIPILAVLTFFSLISTVYVDSYDRVYYTGDTAILHILAVLLLYGVIFPVFKKFRLRVTDRIIFWTLAAVTLFCAVFITCADMPPRFDQRAVWSVAGNLLVGIRDDFMPGGYAEIYPHNQGIILFYYLILGIVGYENYMVLQYINLIFMVLTQIALYLIMKRLTVYFREVTLGLILFMPYWGYVSFIYGNIPGFCMGVWGLYFCLKYFEGLKPYDAVLTGLFISFAFRFQEHFAIFIIALFIMTACELMKGHRAQMLVIIVSVMVFCGLTGFIVNGFFEAKADYRPGKGIPGLPYIAMGLHEQEERGAGWHDNYPEDTYEEVGHDSEISAGYAKEDIAGSIDNFRKHPSYMAGFFIRKTASIWNEPTYYSWALQQGRNEKWDETVFFPGTVWVQGIMNIFQTVLYFFAMMYFIYHRKDAEFIQLFFALHFIGGFLCHTVWEAHCQYALFYAMGLAVYSTVGMIETFKLVYPWDRRKKTVLVSVMVAAGLAASAPQTAAFLTLNRDDIRYGEYLLTLLPR